MQVTKSEARSLFIHQQLSKQKSSTLEIIQQLGYVQIDTISVVERAHHHTLWTRNPGYHPNEINKLLIEKKVFEYWGHAMSYLPIEHYRYYLPKIHSYPWNKGMKTAHEKTNSLQQEILAEIKNNGPKKSSDFQHEKRKGGWWNWKPAKVALECLYNSGQLMIKRRDGFQRVYDLAEKILPNDIDTKPPTESEYLEFFTLTAVKNLGMATLKDIQTYINIVEPRRMKNTIQSMLEANQLQEISVEGVPEAYFCLPSNANSKYEISEQVHILSPFDNLVINRDRLEKLFGFEYKIECYTPAPKRKYGYFNLPILYKNSFIGRMDCKAHRKTKTLQVISLHFEPNYEKSKYEQLIEDKLEKFMQFNGCEKVERGRNQTYNIS